MELIDREKLKEKKVFLAERNEYVVPVAEIDWQPTVNTWISVEQRLPEIDEYVLFIATDGSMFMGGRDDDEIHWSEDTGHWRFVDNNIVAYMPIPEYKRNKDAEVVNKVEYTEEQEQAKKSYIDEHIKEIVGVDCMGR